MLPWWAHKEAGDTQKAVRSTARVGGVLGRPQTRKHWTDWSDDFGDLSAIDVDSISVYPHGCATGVNRGGVGGTIMNSTATV